jgi:anionic cell wall polymer biosynthesis LytR-Cps2A-Psr (LCP) family protein
MADRAGSGSSVIVVIATLVAIPHVAVYRYGTAFGDAFERIFQAPSLARVADDGEDRPAGPGPDERPERPRRSGSMRPPGRTSVLTDTMMVVSFDPVGKTASMVSLPRDLVNVPLGGGDDYGPKLNSLLSYADRHPKDFPKGGLADPLPGCRSGALLGHPDPLLRDDGVRSASIDDGRMTVGGARHRRLEARSTTPGYRRLRAGRRWMVDQRPASTTSMA